MPHRIHHAFAFRDECEVEVGDDHALPLRERHPEVHPLR